MSVRIVGTRAPEIDATSTWFEPLPETARGAVLVAAYWDESVGDHAEQVSAQIPGGTVRILLWVNGGSGPRAWERLSQLGGDESIEVRLVNSPSSGGIFHTKVNGLTDSQRGWLMAYVGSANLTKNGYSKNVELGAVFTDASALSDLKDWFEDQWQIAVPLTADLLDNAAEIVASNAEVSKASFEAQKAIGSSVVPRAKAAQVHPAGPARGSTPPGDKKWWKQLSASDAAQYSAKANPQSMITMTQASGLVNDPDAYFLDDFFAEEWSDDSTYGGRKFLDVDFDVRILGQDYGKKTVRFTWHQERRERQHGPATHLHLQPNLEALFQEQNLTGKYIVLSQSATGYLLEIVEQKPDA